MRFSALELRDLFFAWIILSVAFSILFVGESGLFSPGFVLFFGVSALTVGVGFVLHEMAHKFVAQRYGLYAEFKAFYGMLLIAVGLAFVGFIFAAPGAVMIKGLIDRRKNGIISVAGPVVNIVLSVLFLLPLFFFEFSDIWGLVFSMGFRINALLAVFNMIPVMPFDGAKVFSWDKKVYWITAGVALLLFIVSWVV